LSGAGLLRVLLVLLITAHSMALFVFALRGADFAWAWARVHPPTFESVAIAAVCFAFTAVLTIRFFLLTAALLTARHDSADMLVEGIRLDPQQHEALFQHVADVARRLGAPVPHEVWISEEARCFSFEQRKFGFSTHRILVLVLGLPHLMILRADELAVIVGHELVHLRQQDTTLALFFFRFSQFLETSLAAARRSPLLWLNPCIWLEWVSFRTLIREWFVSNRFEDLVDQRLKESRLGRDNDPRTIYEQFRDEWQEISSKAQQFLRDRLEELEPQSYWDSHPTLKERLNAVSAYPNFGTDPAGPVAELLNTMDSLLRQISGPVTSEAVNDTVKMTARELQRPLPQRAPAAEEMG
jgi:Zn-dependent protease with chaperone function